MASAEQEMETDPITAALPPNSDYITYLTILEYQLTPERLPILTKHLAEDDGTLAREIGWDLVKLILPLVEAAPNEAGNCLEVVARRGNPREVVVRVAEAMETLGADDGGIDSGSDQQLEVDELPTFEGEAQRIHLGEMALQGMPPSSTKAQQSGATPVVEELQDASAIPDSFSTQFSKLLSILPLLHSRIKTQYPSRFLATSLPAALGAYRRIPITSETTVAFVTLLGKMSGKQRPTLPPRSSTASVTHLQATATPGTEVYAPLPDPEGGSKENEKAPSNLEMSIVLRLLQAVTLEVLEEYLFANPSTMEWATRLLEKHNRNKAIPDRKSRSKTWQDDKVLQSRDDIMGKFLRLAKDLHLDPEAVFKSTNLPLARVQNLEEKSTNTSAEKDGDEEPSEFPTSPSQIPYSHLGALFLFLARKVPTLVYSDDVPSPLVISTPDLHHFVNQFVVPTPTPLTDQLIPSVAHNPPSAIDALLALLLLTLPPQNSSVDTSKSNEDTDYKSLITILSYLSAEHPDPAFRTSAHHLATTLLHNHPSSAFRLATIKSTITDCGPFENLKEVAINWLKEEILSTIPNPAPSTSSTTRGEAEAHKSSNSKNKNIFVSPTLFSDDETLGPLIFPTSPLLDQTPTPETSTPLPQSAIPSLNLLFLLLTNPTLKPRYNLAPKISTIQQQSSPTSSPQDPSTTTTIITTTVDSSSEAFESKALAFLTNIQEFVDEHAEHMGSKEEEGRLGLLGLAVGRVVGALEGYRNQEQVRREREREEEQVEEGAGAGA
jgi:Uncharacterised protein family, YAP/Alf4/glomulin